MAENAPLIGRTLAGRFRITGYIGEGGMATVYRGVQDGDSRDVAIKVMAADLVKDRKFVRRFRREAKAASMLKHANTVEILEFGVDGDIVYLAMECIEGMDLAMLLERDRRLTEARAASVVMQVCAALSVAHAQQIVHRDLKPDNIMITAHPKERGQDVVKVLDFGIAKILDEDEGPMPDPRMEPQSHAPSLLTRVGTIVGTPAYMSPEQGRAEKVDARTDIYACGVLLYELVTGRTPFGGETPMQVVMRHVNETPAPPSSWVEIHAGLEKVILKALKKWPAERHQSADEMARELKAVLPELAGAKRPLVPQGAGGRPPSADQAPPTTGSPAAAAAARAAAPPTPPVPTPATTRRTPDPAPDDDEPNTLMIPDAGAAAAVKAAIDKKLVFPTLNIDLPEEVEKALASRKSPTLESQAAASAPARRPAAPAAPPPSAADEDDDARTLIARSPTGPGPAIEIGPGGGLALAQTLASEAEAAEKEMIAKARAIVEANRPPPPSKSDPELAPSAAEADIAVPKAAKDESDKDKLGLAKTLPIGQADIDLSKLALAAPAAAARAPMASLSDMGSSAGHVPAAPRKGLSVGMAMVLGALIGALVVGGIVVALVSMR